MMTPEPKVGQVWRNRVNGRLVRVDQIRLAVSIRGYDRIMWTALDGPGPKTGGRYRQYWQTRFEFVAESEAEL